VLPRTVRKRVTIEAQSPFGWDRYAGDEGAIIGIDRFGASAPAEQIFKALGITADRLVEVAREVVRDGFHGRVTAPGGNKH
jgi:transketolase